MGTISTACSVEAHLRLSSSTRIALETRASGRLTIMSYPEVEQSLYSLADALHLLKDVWALRSGDQVKRPKQ